MGDVKAGDVTAVDAVVAETVAGASLAIHASHGSPASLVRPQCVNALLRVQRPRLQKRMLWI